jgi:hypothetical protein
MKEVKCIEEVVYVCHEIEVRLKNTYASHT